jgi:phenylpyruvate tautomerase PptA (4-oxalocrotonate tautomerase family)
MPNIFLKFPKGVFDDVARAKLVHSVNEAAATAECIPADPRKRFLCWVGVEEFEPGRISCGGADMGAQTVTCMALVHVPDGVLDDGARAKYVALLHDAFVRALPAGDARHVMSSVILHEVPDGTWGANGQIWRLPQFAAAAGYRHLEHLVGSA